MSLTNTQPPASPVGTPSDGFPALAVEQLLAATMLLALGLDQVVIFGATVGFGALLALAPIWIRVVRESSWAKVFVLLALACAIWGEALDKLAAADHLIRAHDSRATIFLTLEITLGAVALLWAGRVLPVWQLGVWFGLGMLIHSVVKPGNLSGTNSLKFDWLIPIALVTFAVAHRSGRTLWQVAVPSAITVLAAVADARAFMATAFVTLVLVIWQHRPRVLGLRSSWAWTAAMIVGFGVAVYNLATTLLINGYLGSAAQMRSIQQVDTTGSLLLGGRPELSATWALMRHFPGGFGPGVVANYNEINVAKAGMASINYNPDNGYVDRFMFGSTIELHSTFGDLWAAFGYVGLLLCAVILLFVFVGVSRHLASRSATALIVFFSIWTFWNILFSPLLSAAPTTLFVLGLLLVEGERLRASSRVPGHPPRIGKSSLLGPEAGVQARDGRAAGC